jgi:hypothetical protein
MEIKRAGGGGSTVDKPSYLVVVSVVKIDTGYTLPPFPHPVHLISLASTYNHNQNKYTNEHQEHLKTMWEMGNTLVFRIILVQRHRQNLLLENIDLIQKQYDTRPRKPRRIYNRAKQGERFFHAVDGVDFEEDLVVFGEGDAEDYAGNCFETVDPFFTFGSLAADVKHATQLSTATRR